MKKKLCMIGLTLIAIAGILAVDENISNEQMIFINEVRSWDSAVTRDGYYGSDYIELYNASKEEVSLNGWYVSDDMEDLQKCQLQDVTIAANGYALLYANGLKNCGDSLNFKLNPTGEKIFLSDSKGNLVDSVYVPEQEFGTVYARTTDGADMWAVKEATTAYSNDEAQTLLVRNLETPIFSHKSGFYEEEFVLKLKAAKGEKIYYTLDGSVPTKESLVYEDGILIQNISAQPNLCNTVQNVVPEWRDYTPSDKLVDKAVIVRAVAVNDENCASEVVTNTYFVGEEKYKEKNVLSVVADFEDLFGKDGIFVTGECYDEWYLCEDGTVEWAAPNFLLGGRQWEIQGNLQLIEAGEETLNQKTGIRTQGASTRMYAKKRMSLYAREEYSGSQYFDGFNLGGKQSHSFSLNESLSNIALPELVKDRNVAVQKAMEMVAFLNGEYWYDTYALEKYNKYYLEETYGVSKDNVMIIKNQSSTEGPENSWETYWQMLDFVFNHDMSSEENYAILEEMADMQSYIDYICANVYLCNMDMSEMKNYLAWKTIEDDGSEIGDGRWRWMMYDTDCVEWMNPEYYGAESKAEVNSFTQKMEYTGTAINEHTLYSAVKNNEKFRRQFVLSFLDMANVNFSEKNVNAVFEKWNTTPQIYGDFFEKRFECIVPYMAEEFDLTGTLENVTLMVNDTAGGMIALNTTTPDLSQGSWKGRYYTDYPVTVTAIPTDGYEFVGWSGSVTSKEVTVEADVLEGGIVLEAVFEKTAE